MSVALKVKMIDEFFKEFVDVVSNNTRKDLEPLPLEAKIDRFQNNFSFYNALYFIASGTSKDYKGAEWLMAHCKESDVFFMYPKCDLDVNFEVKGEELISDNKSRTKTYYFDAKMFGLIVSLSAFECMLYSLHQKGKTNLAINYSRNGKQLKDMFCSISDRFLENSKFDDTQLTLKISGMKSALNNCLSKT